MRKGQRGWVDGYAVELLERFVSLRYGTFWICRVGRSDGVYRIEARPASELQLKWTPPPGASGPLPDNFSFLKLQKW